MQSSAEFTFSGRVVRIPLSSPVAAQTPQHFAGSSSRLNPAFLPGATAHRVWPCSKVVAEWLHSATAPPLANSSVIELGAGCGLAGLAAHLAGATHVCLTDLAENLPRLEQIVSTNGCSTQAVWTEALDWTQPLPPTLQRRRWEFVLVCDCVFWPPLFEPLLATIASLSSNDAHTRVILAMVDRISRAQQFAAVARAAGWELVSLPRQDTQRGGASPTLAAMQREACELCELRRRAGAHVEAGLAEDLRGGVIEAEYERALAGLR